MIAVFSIQQIPSFACSNYQFLRMRLTLTQGKFRNIYAMNLLLDVKI